MTSEPHSLSTGVPPGVERQLADLRDLLEVSRQLSGTLSIERLLTAIEASCLRVFDCECFASFLHDRASDELYSLVATGIGTNYSSLQIRFNASRGIAGHVLRTGAVLNIPDAYADPRFASEVDLKTGKRTRNLLACPLLGLDGIAIGVLEVVNKRRDGFTAWDEELIQVFAAQAGVALQRALLLAERAEKQHIEAELDIARTIQQQLLPNRSPTVPGFDVAGWNRPADQTGGDFFDFLSLDDGRLAIILADVSGHGLGPSLLAAVSHSMLRATLTLTASLERAVPLVNRMLAASMPQGRFVTAFVGLLLPEQDCCTYVSAGQGPILLYRSAEEHVSQLPTHGFPLGILVDASYDQAHSVAFTPGDLLLLCTDGFPEWPNKKGDRFGDQRLQRLLQQYHHLPAAEIIHQIHHSVLEFAQDVSQQDDLTAVVIKKL